MASNSLSRSLPDLRDGMDTLDQINQKLRAHARVCVDANAPGVMNQRQLTACTVAAAAVIEQLSAVLEALSDALDQND
jgi:hypothetical protein